ncbi:unnamed protein product [Leptosia nina]|uniref:Nanos-type domain-containing protein n=1 Tax=Leptosia nina TaxID=320188 RepID=A0AAV1IW23_9NEOP
MDNFMGWAKRPSSTPTNTLPIYTAQAAPRAQISSIDEARNEFHRNGIDSPYEPEETPRPSSKDTSNCKHLQTRLLILCPYHTVRTGKIHKYSLFADLTGFGPPRQYLKQMSCPVERFVESNPYQNFPSTVNDVTTSTATPFYQAPSFSPEQQQNVFNLNQEKVYWNFPQPNEFVPRQDISRSYAPTVEEIYLYNDTLTSLWNTGSNSVPVDKIKPFEPGHNTYAPFACGLDSQSYPAKLSTPNVQESPIQFKPSGTAMTFFEQESVNVPIQNEPLVPNTTPEASLKENEVDQTSNDPPKTTEDQSETPKRKSSIEGLDMFEHLKNMNVDLNNITPEQLEAALPIIYLIKGLENHYMFQKKKLPQYCRFCRNNGERETVCKSHVLRIEGRVTCPILRALKCTKCGAHGDDAHTIKYCPLATPEERKVSTMLMQSRRHSSERRRNPRPLSGEFPLESARFAPTHSYREVSRDAPRDGADRNCNNNLQLHPLWAELEHYLERQTV